MFTRDNFFSVIKRAKGSSRILITLGVSLLAIVCASLLWGHYMNGPWTRDGRVRADVVLIAPDVDGLVTQVLVTDNQLVHKGDLLFVIDPLRYKQKLSEAESLVLQRRADLDMRRQQAKRRVNLDDQVISRETREDSKLEETLAAAKLDEAMAFRDLARTNLERTEVRATEDGWVTNLDVYVGEFIQPGQARMALVSKDSFWVYGYFEENRLHGIHIGSPAEVTLMGSNIVLKGKVESIARGITDRDNPSSKSLLADVNPSFSWVRLAQRIPVRIALDSVPTNVQLVSGMSCSISVK